MARLGQLVSELDVIFTDLKCNSLSEKNQRKTSETSPGNEDQNELSHFAHQPAEPFGILDPHQD